MFEVEEAALVVSRPVVMVWQREEMQMSASMLRFVVLTATAGSMVGVMVEMVPGVAATVGGTKLTATTAEYEQVRSGLRSGLLVREAST